MPALRQFIEGDFKKKQTRNPRYSLRAYARYLDISPTSLSLFLSGRRQLSSNSVEVVAKKLGLSEDLITELSGGQSLEGTEFEELSMSAVPYFSEWYYFAILSIMETEDFESNHSWIAKRLGISSEIVIDCLQNLSRFGMIKYNRSGVYTATEKQYSIPDRYQSYVNRRIHIQGLDLAQNSLENDPIEMRQFSAMTMAIDPKKLPEAAKRIQRFRRRLTKFLETGEKREVYRLSVQLFPLTKVTK